MKGIRKNEEKIFKFKEIDIENLKQNYNFKKQSKRNNTYSISSHNYSAFDTRWNSTKLINRRKWNI